MALLLPPSRNSKHGKSFGAQKGFLLGPTPAEAKSGGMELGSNYGRSSIIESLTGLIAARPFASGGSLRVVTGILRGT